MNKWSSSSVKKSNVRIMNLSSCFIISLKLAAAAVCCDSENDNTGGKVSRVFSGGGDFTCLFDNFYITFSLKIIPYNNRHSSSLVYCCCCS